MFERLEKENRSNDIRSGSHESVRFWSRIWYQPVIHNGEEKWLKKVERQLRGTVKQRNIAINSDKLKKQLRRVKNWKAPRPDGLQGYWVNTFSSCDERIAARLHLRLERNETILIKAVKVMKDREKGNGVSSFRPITCFFLMWKIFTRILRDEMYDHVESERLLPEEQKECQRK